MGRTNTETEMKTLILLFLSAACFTFAIVQCGCCHDDELRQKLSESETKMRLMEMRE